MSDEWSTKQFAMRLMLVPGAGGFARTPEDALNTALRFERLWAPEQARGEAFFEVFKNAKGAPAVDAPEFQSWVEAVARKARSAGNEAEERTRRFWEFK